MTTLEQLNRFYEDMLPSEKCVELLEEYDGTMEGFILFGANQVGIGLKRMMQKIGLNVLSFLDEYLEADVLDGLTVLHTVEEVKKRYSNICFVVVANVRTSRKIMMEKLNSAFDNCAILNEEVVSYCMQNNSLNNDGGVYLKEAYVQITNMCTLKCRGCCTEVPTLPPELKNHYPFEELKKDIESFGKIVSGVSSVYITGGEPFLYPELAETIHCLKEHVHIGQLYINTNATLMPSDNVLEAASECSVIIRASDYGKLSVRLSELLAVCEKWGVTVFSRPADAFPWVEYEEMYDRSGDGKIQMESCREYGCFNAYRGRLFPCEPMMRQHEQKLYEPKAEDFIDLSEDTDTARIKLKILVERISKKNPFYGCRFCGTEYKEIKAAVQLE